MKKHPHDSIGLKHDYDKDEMKGCDPNDHEKPAFGHKGHGHGCMGYHGMDDAGDSGDSSGGDEGFAGKASSFSAHMAAMRKKKGHGATAIE